MNDTTTKEGAEDQGRQDANKGYQPATPETFKTNTEYLNYQNAFDWQKQQQGR
jgi:hypothetical protein